MKAADKQVGVPFSSVDDALHFVSDLDNYDVVEIEVGAWVLVSKATGEVTYSRTYTSNAVWEDVGNGTWDSKEEAENARTRDDMVGLDLVAVKEGSGWILEESATEPYFFMYDSEFEADSDIASLEKEGYVVNNKGMKSQVRDDVLDSIPPAFMESMLNLFDHDADARDQVYQLYLESLPELSQRKSFIHRKKTKGFEESALRGFAKTMFHMAHQISKMKAAPYLDAIRENLDDEAKQAPMKDKVRVDQFVDEIKRRHKWVMNPTSAGWTNVTSAIGFTMYLGLSPASALVNLSQVPILTFPTLASKYGFKAAYDALMGAVKEVSARAALLDKREAMGLDGLSDKEKKAFKYWGEQGVYDNTLSQSLAGIGDTDNMLNSAGFNKAMGAVGHLFHKAEVINRQVTLLASYRLAKDNGATDSEAMMSAADVTWDTQFDYGNANRARFMQNDVAKVLLMFKSYSQHMVYFMWRGLANGYGGKWDSKEAKTARIQLNSALGMTFLFAGTAGLPLWAVFGVANALHWEDEDEVWDAETEFRAYLHGMGLVGDVVDRGFANLLGLDMSSRVSLDGLLWRSINYDSEGRDAYHSVLSGVAGPLVGLVGKGFNASKLAADDHEWRAVEQIMPKFARDVMKATRYASEGALNTRGLEIVAKEDMNVGHWLMQAAGFSPDKLGLQYDKNSGIKNYENAIKRRKQRLLAAYSLARNDKDKGEMERLWNAMVKFSKANPVQGITKKKLARSMKTRDRIRRESNGSIWMRNSTVAMAERLGYVEKKKESENE